MFLCNFVFVLCLLSICFFSTNFWKPFTRREKLLFGSRKDIKTEANLRKICNICESNKSFANLKKKTKVQKNVITSCDQNDISSSSGIWQLILSDETRKFFYEYRFLISPTFHDHLFITYPRLHPETNGIWTLVMRL